MDQRQPSHVHHQRTRVHAERGSLASSFVCLLRLGGSRLPLSLAADAGVRPSYGRRTSRARDREAVAGGLVCMVSRAAAKRDARRCVGGVEQFVDGVGEVVQRDMEGGCASKNSLMKDAVTPLVRWMMSSRPSFGSDSPLR